MPELKTIGRDAIPRAIQKAERYRLLNQPWATESICLDILEVDSDNQPVVVMLLLAITDQFGPSPRALAGRARDALARVTDPYQKAYYTGIINERLGHAQLEHDAMHAESMANDALRKAMASYEDAERLRPPGNDDAILRWNTCARILDRLRAEAEDEGKYEPVFGE